MAKQKEAWDKLSMLEKALLIKLSVDNGVSSLKLIRDTYNLYSSGGNLGAYNTFVETLPDNMKHTDPAKYDMYRYWELNGRPKDFEEAKQREMFLKESDGYYHDSTLAEVTNSPDKHYGTLEFIKAKNHNTIGLEVGAYLKDKNHPMRNREYILDYTGDKARYRPRTYAESILPEGAYVGNIPITALYANGGNTSQVVQGIRQRLAHNINPFSYEFPFLRTVGAVVFNRQENERRNYDTSNIKYMQRLAAWSKYLDTPVDEITNLENYIVESKYQPSKYSNPNAVYYSYKPQEGQSLVDAYRATSGYFTMGLGEDAKGKYISLYDLWDLNPIDARSSSGDGSFGIGKPFEAYDRIYESDNPEEYQKAMLDYEGALLLNGEKKYGDNVVTFKNGGHIGHWKDGTLEGESLELTSLVKPTAQLMTISGFESPSAVSKIDLNIIQDYISRFTLEHPNVNLDDLLTSLSLVPLYESSLGNGVVASWMSGKLNQQGNFTHGVAFDEYQNKDKEINAGASTLFVKNPKNALEHELLGHGARDIALGSTSGSTDREKEIIGNAYPFLLKNVYSHYNLDQEHHLLAELFATNTQLRAMLQQNTGLYGEAFNKYIDSMSYEDLYNSLYTLNSGYYSNSDLSKFFDYNVKYTEDEQNQINELQASLLEIRDKRNKLAYDIYEERQNENVRKILGDKYDSYFKDREKRKLNYDAQELEVQDLLYKLKETLGIKNYKNANQIEAIKNALKTVAYNNINPFEVSNNTYLAAFGGPLSHKKSTGGLLYPFSFEKNPFFKTPVVRYDDGGFFARLFGKKDTLPTPEEIKADRVERFINDTWETEYSVPRGYDPTTGLFYPYKSPEGGTKTIGPGFKLRADGSGDATMFSAKEAAKGVTREQINEKLRAQGELLYDKVLEFLNQKGNRLPVDTINPNIMNGLMDLRFLVGALGGWDNLREAVLNGDLESIKKESLVTFKDGDTGKIKPDVRRNELRAKKFWHYD